MTTKTKQDIIDYFKGTDNIRPGEEWDYNNNAAEAAMYDDWDQPENWDNVTSKSVAHYGGEDCGSTYYTVYQFDLEGGETFWLKFNGWYASHYGCDYEDFSEAKPKTVTNVEYF